MNAETAPMGPKKKTLVIAASSHAIVTVRRELQHEKIACGSDGDVTANGKQRPDAESFQGRAPIDAAGLTFRLRRAMNGKALSRVVLEPGVRLHLC